MNGKTIVLVGGSSGIGQAVLNRLTGEGADVLHFSRSKALRNAPAGVSHNVFDAVSDELAPRIRVNAVAPSLTDTPLASGLLSDEDRRKAAAERHPLKRFGSAQDIAAVACFLLGESASWITGQVIGADGGMGVIRLFR